VVTPLARRRPWNVAGEAAGVDQLSGGRMILGVGLGETRETVAVDASLVAFGERPDARRRGEMLDEGLEILAGLWTGEPFSFRGRHFTVAEVTFLPRPVQRPRIPIWVGGAYPNPRPTRRAARWDGSCRYRETQGGPWRHMTPDDVRALRVAAGDRPFTIAVGGSRRGEDWAAEREHIRAVAAAGADWWIEWVPPADRATMRRGIECEPLRIGSSNPRPHRSGCGARPCLPLTRTSAARLETLEDLCRAGAGPGVFAAWVALLCRVGGGPWRVGRAVPRGWWWFAARVVVRCLVGRALPRE
jgi:Luciferase-like monooxygenase